MKNKKHSKLKTFLNSLLGKANSSSIQDSYSYDPGSSENYQPLVHNYRMTEPGSRMITGDAYSARSVQTPGTQYC